MAILADLASRSLLEELEGGSSACAVRGVAIDTRGGIGILRLPLWQEGVEVPVEAAGLRHVAVAFEAVAITDRDRQRGGLLVGVGEVGNKVSSADQERSHTASHAGSGMAVDAAHALCLMKAGQINGGLLLRPLEEARLGLCVT